MGTVTKVGSRKRPSKRIKRNVPVGDAPPSGFPMAVTRGLTRKKKARRKP